MKDITRRDLIKLGGVAAAGVAATGALAGCSSQSSASGSSQGTQAASATTGEVRTDPISGQPMPAFFAAPEAITEIFETREYDIVVVGAGAAGVPCALSAAENGASVALLQKQSVAISQGNTGSGIILDTSSPEGVEALVAKIMRDCANRGSRKLMEDWAQNSGEAVQWVIDRSSAQGASVSDDGNRQHQSHLEVGGYGPLNFVTSFFGPKPYNAGDGMQALAAAAEAAGVEIFYETPAQQLVKDGDKVIGVIGTDKDGNNIQFNGTKGVVLATGDYQNDEEMSNYYLPDLKYFERKQFDKTGDGQKMGVWAGGHMEPLNHTKMLHDFDAGPASMCDMPFLDVNQNGERFINETVEMSLINNYLRQEENTGWYAQIFDSTYLEFAATWPGKLVDPEGLKVYEPEDPAEKVGVWEPYIGTYVADTIADLAAKLEMPADKLQASIDRYNELADAGLDTDFGVPAEYLHRIDTPPFYGIHRHLRISAVCSGLDINDEYQVLDDSMAPIEGLYAIGNCSGRFYGSVDYPMTVPGLSLGRCYTEGYLLGRTLATA